MLSQSSSRITRRSAWRSTSKIFIVYRGRRTTTRYFGRQFGNNDPFGRGGGNFGGGQFGGGGGFRRGIDDATLKQVAEMTGGNYYSAESATELQNIFQNLPTYLITKHEVAEVSFIFVVIGALLAALAMALALIWQPLP